MDINAISKKIKEYAEGRDYVTDREIFSLAKECLPNFNSSFKNILISMLMGEGVIYSYNLHIYKIYGKRNEFIPYQDIDVERRLIKYLGDKQIKISYFVSSLFNSLSSLQSMKTYLFVGAESYAINYLLDKIEKDNKKVIASTDLAKLRKLFPGIELGFDYVLKTINEDTPLFKKRNDIFCYPKLETLLVDLVTDKLLLDLYSSEIENIYINAFKKYAIKINRLLRYADKKGAKEKIFKFIQYIDFNIERGKKAGVLSNV